MKHKAFTLIEVMITVGIIGLLSAVALSSYHHFSIKSKWGEVMPCITDTAINLENYRSERGVYPTEDIWASINRDSICGDYYAGAIWVDEDGSHFVVAYCDSKKAIAGDKGDDIWVVSDTNPNPIHYRNALDGSTEELSPAVLQNRPACPEITEP